MTSTPTNGGAGLLALLTLAAAAACGDPVGPPPDTDAPIRTDRSRYVLEVEDGFLVTEIVWTYTNRTGRDVFLANCNGHIALRLEKWEGEAWRTAWGPAIPECLSPPIVIGQGEDHTTTLHVQASPPGDDRLPRFEVEEGVDGWYRIVLDRAAASHGQGEPLPEEDRVSVSFELEDPR